MALDTRNKRASALACGLAFRLVCPGPDGTIDQADRQQTALLYSGIAAQTLYTTVATISNPTTRRSRSGGPWPSSRKGWGWGGWNGW